jgi:hypothetical protein
MHETSQQMTVRMAKYKPEPPKRYCEWCGKELPKNSPSAMKYHEGKCKLMGYREHNARASRAFRFRREMGIARRR